MYAVVLSIHNIFRWIVFLLGIFIAIRSTLGWFLHREWTTTERKAGSYFTISLDVQLFLGLLLYFFLSPKTGTALQDFSSAMRVIDLRFFALEHPLYMFLAVIFAHLGNVLSKRSAEMSTKFRNAAIWYSLSLLAIILGMPWMASLFPNF